MQGQAGLSVTRRKRFGGRRPPLPVALCGEAPESFPIHALHTFDSSSNAPQVDFDHRQGNIALWHGLCRARVGRGDHDHAVTDCGNVLILDPNHREAKMQLVRSHRPP